MTVVIHVPVLFVRLPSYFGGELEIERDQRKWRAVIFTFKSYTIQHSFCFIKMMTTILIILLPIRLKNRFEYNNVID